MKTNEPVAYLMVERNDGNSYIQMGVPTRDEKISHQPYPLYTHPAKTLTISDRDILKIIHDKFTKFGFEAEYIVEDTELIDFARAILRKAQG